MEADSTPLRDPPQVNFFYFAAAGVVASAAGAGLVWKIFNAFCTVNVRPQPAGTNTISHATAINTGELFFTVSSAIPHPNRLPTTTH
jgi:hypothetical protein